MAQQHSITVCGYVKDSLTDETLTGVTIVASKRAGTTTNNYGFFSINAAPGGQDFLFSYIGYQTVHLQMVALKDTTLVIKLVPQNLTVNEVVVKGRKPQFVAIDNLGKVSLNSSQLKYMPSFMGEADVIKYLQMQPGVTSGKELSSGMNIRGGSADQTLVLLDEMPIYNQAHAFGLVSIFSGESIKTSELYKGSIPPSYGGRLSGVVALQMREGNRNEHVFSVQLGTTTVSASAQGYINKGKGTYFVSGRYFIPDILVRGVYAVLPKNNRMRTYIGFYDVTAKASYDVGKKTTLYASFYTGHDALKFGYREADQEKVLLNKSTGGLSWGNLAGSVRLTSQLSNRLFMSAIAYYSFLGNSNDFDFSENVEGQKIKSRIKSQMEEIGVKATFDHTVTGFYKLTYGVNAGYQFFRPQIIRNDRNGTVHGMNYGQREMFSTVAFLNNEFKVGNLGLNVGARVGSYYNFTKNYFGFEPRASLNYNLKGNKFWLSYVRNVQSLFSMSQSYYTLPVDYWLPFTDDTGISSSEQVTVGYNRYITDNLQVNAELYYKTSKNICMVYNNDDFLRDEGGYDKARGKAYGAEVSLIYNNKRFSGTAAYAYSKSQLAINGVWRDFIYDTPHWLNVFAAYNIVAGNVKKHTISMNVNYKTGLPYILSSERYTTAKSDDRGEMDIIAYPKYPNMRLRDFFRVDLSYTMEKKLKRGSRVWQFSVLNATAYNNPYMVYQKRTYSKSYIYKGISLIPFLPSFSYKRIF